MFGVILFFGWLYTQINYLAAYTQTVGFYNKYKL